MNSHKEGLDKRRRLYRTKGAQRLCPGKRRIVLQLIQDMLRSWVRGKGAWSTVRKGENLFFPAQALLGEIFCWDDMRDRKRENTHTVVGKSAMANKQTKLSSLSSGIASTSKW